MKIQLELDDFRFTTMRSELGETRVLLVTIEGKPFAVYKQKNDEYRWPDPKRDEAFDRLLIQIMERMLRKVFVDACAAIPDGTNLLEDEG